LAGCAVGSIGNAEGPARAVAAFGEVDSVAGRIADAVEGQPAEERSIYPALQDEVFEQPPDRVVD
jgi:hypothetical protein